MYKLLNLIFVFAISSCVSVESIGVAGDLKNNNVNEIFINTKNYKPFSQTNYDDISNLVKKTVPKNVFMPGDSIQITILESGSTSLFRNNSSNLNQKNISNNSNQSTLPIQIVDLDGKIFVPYLGIISVSGMNVNELRNFLYNGLKPKSNNPQIFIDAKFTSSAVNISGDIKNSMIYELKGGETFIDAIGISGGLIGEKDNYMLTLTRDNQIKSFPLEDVFSASNDEIRLLPNDNVVFENEPFVATVLGASNSNTNISFGPNNSSLLSIIGKVSGVNNYRGDLKKVYIFRKNPKGFNFSNVASQQSNHVSIFQNEQKQSTKTLEYSLIHVDISNKNSLLYSSTFKVLDNDIVIISNNSIYESQRVLGIIGSIFSPVSSAINAQNLSN